MTRGHFSARAAINDCGTFRPEAQSRTRGVHRHVPGAKYRHMLAGIGRRVKIGEIIGAPEVHAGQVLVGGKHADEVFSGNTEELRQTRPHADEHGLVALIEQLLNGNRPAADPVGTELNVVLAQAIKFRSHDILGQTEGRDAVDKHPARFMERFKHRYLDPARGEVSRDSDGRRAGADTGNLQIRIGDGASVVIGHAHAGIMHGIVGDKAFQTANSHRLALDAQDALAFTLVFLRAHTAAHGGKAVGALQDTVGFRYVTLDDLSDEFGNTDFNRTPLTAARIFALEATAGFKLRLFQRVAECDFLEVVRPHSSGLAGHVDAGRFGGFLHILSVCHGSCTCARDVRWIAFPETGRRTSADAVRRSPLCAHQIPGRRHR